MDPRIAMDHGTAWIIELYGSWNCHDSWNSAYSGIARILKPLGILEMGEQLELQCILELPWILELRCSQKRCGSKNCVDPGIAQILKLYKSSKCVDPGNARFLSQILPLSRNIKRDSGIAAGLGTARCFGNAVVDAFAT
jgi:hypothetical protein